MSTAAQMFRVRALRVLGFDHGRVMTGAEFLLPAQDAAALIRRGDAALSDDADLPRLFAQLGLHNGARRWTQSTTTS
jgi:hypothetical protein